MCRVDVVVCRSLFGFVQFVVCRLAFVVLVVVLLYGGCWLLRDRCRLLFVLFLLLSVV